MNLPHATGKVARVAIVLALLCPTAVDAQGLARTFPELDEYMEEGERVSVIDTEGRPTEGTLVNLSPSSLTLQVGDTYHDFRDSGVRRIERRDRVLNGMMIGMGIGLGLGALAIEHEVFHGEDALFVFPWSGGIGLGIGTGLDFLRKGRELLYLGRDQTPPATVSVVPMLMKQRQGVAVSIRF